MAFKKENRTRSPSHASHVSTLQLAGRKFCCLRAERIHLPDSAARLRQLLYFSRSSTIPLIPMVGPSGGDPAASQPQLRPAFLLEARAQSGSPAARGNLTTAANLLSSQPLMIELQGDRYVRIRSAAIDGEALPLSLAPDHRLNQAGALKIDSAAIGTKTPTRFEFRNHSCAH